jgi:hypothetical protein
VRAACLGLALLLLGVAPAAAPAADLPVILRVAVPGPLEPDRRAELRVTFRAPGGNVVALIQVVEDLDGPRRSTTQREFSVVARAFGVEEGDVTVPIAFATPGRKRITVTLVTDERAESDPETVEIDVGP